MYLRGNSLRLTVVRVEEVEAEDVGINAGSAACADSSCLSFISAASPTRCRALSLSASRPSCPDLGFVPLLAPGRCLVFLCLLLLLLLLCQLLSLLLLLPYLSIVLLQCSLFGSERGPANVGDLVLAVGQPTLHHFTLAARRRFRQVRNCGFVCAGVRAL